MNREYGYSVIYNFLTTHQLISLGIAVALAIFLWRKPKEFLKFTLFVLAMILLFYVGTIVNDSMLKGVESKHQGIKETHEKIPQ